MKWVCTVCGYVHEGDQPPEACPVCKQPASKFKLQEADAPFATVHEVGVGKAEGVSEDIIADLRANFEGECSEVGMYLAMARVADREGYPEVSAAFTKYAFEEAEHAAKFAELLGEVLTDSTKKNLQMRVDAETGASADIVEGHVIKGISRCQVGINTRVERPCDSGLFLREREGNALSVK